MHPNYKPVIGNNSEPVIGNSAQQAISQDPVEPLARILYAVNKVLKLILESPQLTKLVGEKMKLLIEPTTKAGSQKRKVAEPTNPAKRMKLCSSNLKNQEQSQLDDKELESESVRQQNDIKQNQDQCADVCCRFLRVEASSLIYLLLFFRPNKCKRYSV